MTKSNKWSDAERIRQGKIFYDLYEEGIIISRICERKGHSRQVVVKSIRAYAKSANLSFVLNRKAEY